VCVGGEEGLVLETLKLESSVVCRKRCGFLYFLYVFEAGGELCLRGEMAGVSEGGRWVCVLVRVMDGMGGRDFCVFLGINLEKSVWGLPRGRAGKDETKNMK
jgi:hypothetical protein